MLNSFAEHGIGLVTAIGCGLLIGLERERRKGSGPERRSAGLRSFAVAALAGALACAANEAGLVAVAGLAVALLCVVSYLRSHADDPGLTTEIALFATFLIGVLAVPQPHLAAAAAVALAALLAARGSLHRFATEWLSDGELHDLLLLAALALICWPLLPDVAVPALGGLRPRALLGLLLLLLVLQALAHLAARVLGGRASLLGSGLLGGFVSSTATIASLGARARREPTESRACAAGGVMSTASTWLLALFILVVISPDVAWDVLPMAAAATLVAVALAVWLSRSQPLAAVLPAPTLEGKPASRRMLQPREALVLAALLSGVTLLMSWARSQFGDLGLMGATALAGLLDAHAPLASMAAQHGAGGVDHAALRSVTWVAIAANSLTRAITALVAGGLRYGLRVAGALLASLAAAGLVVALEQGWLRL
ncbi:MAG: MgtC/SapB family protein [Burkholderiales bacterium]